MSYSDMFKPWPPKEDRMAHPLPQDQPLFASADKVFYQVLCNGKLYKAYAEEKDADIAAKALRVWGMEAKVVTVGKP